MCSVYPPFGIFPGTHSITLVELWRIDSSFKRHSQWIFPQVIVLFSQKVKIKQSKSTLLCLIVHQINWPVKCVVFPCWSWKNGGNGGVRRSESGKVAYFWTQQGEQAGNCWYLKYTGSKHRSKNFCLRQTWICAELKKLTLQYVCM